MHKLEKLSNQPTNKLSTVELSGLNSPDKLLEATSHKEKVVMKTLPLFSLVTLDLELNNGLLRNSSKDAVLSMLLESLLEKTRDQEVSLMLNSHQTLKPLKQ